MNERVEQQDNSLKLHENQTITVFEDGFFVPSLGTIRACLDCGVLVAGGPTRCLCCADGATAPTANTTTGPGEAGEGCTVPPAGWQCSRTAGHEGPCAARRQKGGANG